MSQGRPTGWRGIRGKLEENAMLYIGVLAFVLLVVSGSVAFVATGHHAR